MPEPLTAACGQQGTYFELLTVAYGSERVKNRNYFSSFEYNWKNTSHRKEVE